MFKILLGLSYILNITKENSGKTSGRTEAAVAAEGAGGSGLQNTFVFCKTHMRFAKHICVFNLRGLFVEYTFGRTLIFSKRR
jgi:hypothetical protein